MRMHISIKMLINSKHILCRVLNCVADIRMAAELSVRCTTVYILGLSNLTVTEIRTYSFVLEHMFTVTMLTNNFSMFTFCEMNLQILTNYLHVTTHVAAVQNCKRTSYSVFLKEQHDMTLVQYNNLIYKTFFSFQDQTANLFKLKRR